MPESVRSTVPAGDTALESRGPVGAPVAPTFGPGAVVGGPTAPSPATFLAQPVNPTVPAIAAPSRSEVPPVAAFPTAPPPGRQMVTEPKVVSYDEETYRTKPGDTFETISYHFYFTDRYAQALALFNRDHPLASTNAKLDPRALQVNQSVYIPPISILKDRYANGIRETPSSAPAGVSSRSNLAPSTPPPPLATPINRKYKVVGNSERMIDVAKRTLGNSERWNDVLKLNPGFRSELPLPEGTVLTLPGDAVVDVEHTPRQAP